MLSPFPWATIRWPKAPTGSVGEPRAVRVTSHTQTDRATVTGSNSMDEGTYLMAAVLGVPFASLWVLAAIHGLAYVPELRLAALAVLPFLVWRYRVYRRTFSRSRSSIRAGRGKA
jgi:hypothetical protein